MLLTKDGHEHLWSMTFARLPSLFEQPAGICHLGEVLLPLQNVRYPAAVCKHKMSLVMCLFNASPKHVILNMCILLILLFKPYKTLFSWIFYFFCIGVCFPWQCPSTHAALFDKSFQTDPEKGQKTIAKLSSKRLQFAAIFLFSSYTSASQRFGRLWSSESMPMWKQKKQIPT